MGFIFKTFKRQGRVSIGKPAENRTEPDSPGEILGTAKPPDDAVGIFGGWWTGEALAPVRAARVPVPPPGQPGQATPPLKASAPTDVDTMITCQTAEPCQRDGLCPRRAPATFTLVCLYYYYLLFFIIVSNKSS